MILNSGRHTQPDPQSCRVRSLGGRRGGAQKQTTHQETKTKLSSATLNRDKTIQCQRKHRKKHPASNVAAEISTSPTPCCESLRQQHTNNSKQHGALAKIGNMQAGLESISNRVPRNPAIPLHFQKYCFLLKLRHFSQKRSLQQSESHFRGRKHIGFLDSRSGPPQLRWKRWLNKTQLWFTCAM